MSGGSGGVTAPPVTATTTVASIPIELYTTVAPPPLLSSRGNDLYLDDLKFSNPLYFKTIVVPILLTWPLTLLVLVIYLYNIFAKNPNMVYRVSLKINFFPLLLFSTILDNSYDWHTGANVKNYSSSTLLFLIVVFSILAMLSLIFTAGYSWDTIKKGNLTGETVIYSRLGTSDDDEEGGGGRVNLPSNLNNPDRWRTIINEYATINVVWALTVYNIILVIIYVMRYKTHTDQEYIRETDVAYISLTLILFLVPLIAVDYYLFRFPATSSLVLHYLVVSIFALNFTIDFFNQVKVAELMTLITIFVGVFLFIYKLKLFIDIGVKIPSKRD